MMNDTSAPVEKVEVDTSKTNSNQPKEDIRFKNIAEANKHCLRDFKVTYAEMLKIQNAPQNVRMAHHAFYRLMRERGSKLDKHSELTRLQSFVDGFVFAFNSLEKVDSSGQESS